jgi:hypothetical protein
MIDKGNKERGIKYWVRVYFWVEKSIELVGVNSKIVRFCKLFMEKWNIRLLLRQSRK